MIMYILHFQSVVTVLKVSNVAIMLLKHAVASSIKECAQLHVLVDLLAVNQAMNVVRFSSRKH